MNLMLINLVVNVSLQCQYMYNSLHVPYCTVFNHVNEYCIRQGKPEKEVVLICNFLNSQFWREKSSREKT